MARWIHGLVCLVLVAALPAAASASATELSPAANSLSPTSFVASARVDGPATLTITPEGASEAVFSAPMKVEGDRASVRVDGLAPGPYVATWRTGGASTYSSFVAGVSPPAPPAKPVSGGARQLRARAAQAPPGGLYFEGSGLVLQTRFHNFVWSGANGEDPHGWLTLNGAYTLHATVTCASVGPVPGQGAPAGVVLGYRIDTGSYAGRGWINWAEGPGPLGPGGYVHYAGVVPQPPTSCPAPGDPPPPLFSLAGSGPVQEGAVGRRTEPGGRRPTSIIDLFPRIDGAVPSGPFAAFAGVDGAAEGVTLTLYPDGGSEPVARQPLRTDPGEMQWTAEVTDLADGPFVAAWTLDRGHGDSETVLSSFVHASSGVGASSGVAAVQGASVSCGARKACSVRLPISGLDRAWFAVTRNGRTVVQRAADFTGSTARLPGVRRLRAGVYGLTVAAARAGHVYARLGFRLR
jgi:hypothetical protein